MPFVPLRPLALAPLSDEAASIVLAKYFGDVVKAAKELGVDRKDLRRLTWHNPRILNAAHERMELFRIGVKSKILEAVWSNDSKRQRWGVDALYDSYQFRNLRSDAALLALAPAPGQRAKALEADNDRVALERESAAEVEREAAVELERERAAELNGDRRREGEEIVVDNEPSVNLRKALPAQGGSLWPAGIRRPSKRGWR